MSDKEKVYPACRLEDCTACPPHPGEMLKGLYLDELHITIGEFAERIGVSRKAISMIVNGRKSITPEMSIRFSKALNTRPDLWLDFQASYDLWQVKHMKGSFFDKIKPFAAMV